ncbi:hypothetical protein [Vibrio gazogenes]|uniref:Uncharacterized protein n=1 Tax=Vibrio gazogenes DSM 21264 = NBRC 103151 TaxID=1123492 RepID=A0A1M4ZG21_VIBGA|nr:hypothetical protein [Vibrio gazogenes]USP12416.1 hypothetical protein MKS89_08025 [Vibrio gazogenes]SHF16993.1 hypothetical protein SAMN02745781_01600 [Vibrio gazogenes DSM 21264] [Vibrio gazogenes DSM 21264 = NBRC 103151]SJN53422.1 hypothetical protein BQ6471_00436 [Vibrio gazogenes]
MKLSQVLNHTNQFERSKFINCIDKLCRDNKDDTELTKQLDKIDGQLKAASGNEIKELFNLVKKHFRKHVVEQIAIGGPQSSLLINILARDGNCISTIPWIEHLYAKEHAKIDQLSISLIDELESSEFSDFDRLNRLDIYRDCMRTAFNNDLKANRTAKISEDERSILNVLAQRLGLSREEVNAIEHSIDPIPDLGIDSALEYLRENGIIMINRRRSEVMVADEIVDIFHDVLGKEIHDKYVLRILRSLSDTELSSILKNYGCKIRGVDRKEKIATIAHLGLSIRNILINDIHADEATQNQRKERIKQLMEDMDLDIPRIGTRLQDRIDVLIDYLKSSEEDEFNLLSVSGFKELLESLSETEFNVEERIRADFEIENKENLDPERLKALSITPLDILYLYTNDEIKTIRNDMGLSRRGNPRSQIIESFASANDRLIENYNLLATRDLKGLHDAGIDIKESDIGAKFEEITRSILEQLDMNVDEDLRKSINTAKDKTDIIISLDNDDVIIGEAKSFKNGQFAKYSTTSRQVKAYVKRCEATGHRVAQVLIVAPEFSKDFIDAADMDTEINISLLEASGLQKILAAYKQRRNPIFSPKLLTKGGLLKAELISKSI